MQRQMLKSKIHRATVTDCDVDYVGSITLDPELMAQRRPARQRAGPRLGHRQRRPLRHLRDRGRAGLGDGPGERRRRPPDQARRQGDRRLLRRLRRERPRGLLAGRRPRRRRQARSRVDSNPEVLLVMKEFERRASAADRDAATTAQPVTLPRLAEMKARRRADRDGHRLRLPLGPGRRGGGRRHRPRRRHRGDGRARLRRAPTPVVDGRDGDARQARSGAASSTPLLVGDMPFGSYEARNEHAIENAQRFVKEAGCDAVKLERGGPSVERARAIVRAGIPVMGHVGLTPQTATALGGFKAQGKDRRSGATDSPRTRSPCRRSAASRSSSRRFRRRSPRRSSTALEVPVIGIGAGPATDGQVLVFHDLLGITTGHTPEVRQALRRDPRGDGRGGRPYADEVRARPLPGRRARLRGSTRPSSRRSGATSTARAWRRPALGLGAALLEVLVGRVNRCLRGNTQGNGGALLPDRGDAVRGPVLRTI